MKIKKSLYVHIIVFVSIILVFIFFIASLYFTYAKDLIITALSNQEIFSEDIQSRKELISEIFSSFHEVVICTILFGLIVVCVVVKYIIKPIRELTLATKQVAKGNFDVEINLNRNDEIGELADNFNLMVKELENNEYLSKEFMSNVSHEFKTPIASIQGFAKLLEDENTSEEEKKEYISIIIEESERLANLSNNIQNLSKLENKDIVKMEDTIDIAEQIRKCIVILSQKLEEKNINISMNDDIDIKVQANEEMLQQVWINIINNAIKYSNENGEIEITISENEKYVLVRIRDNGIGIEESKKDKIFEKFYQVDNSHGAEGNGLGLAIVKKIIDIHNGNIEVESKIGEGSTFIIELPKQKKGE